ncbi:recombinase family protein [Timonella senegalensis]|uniref:recombinase family protein n=1 Tax=Timonella senegalensis TaxID=1465825 RepID=UPI0028AA9F66|nr:recombinase family protein [Timonella senegalensis]
MQRHTRTITIERNARRTEENLTLPSQKQKRLRPVPEDTAWLPSTVTGILRNPRYAGYSIYTPIMLSSLKSRAEDSASQGRSASGSADASCGSDAAAVSRRRLQHETIVRDENNNPVMGQWEVVVPEDLWWRVQERLDDPSRIKNRGGNTDRKHLGSGLFLCGIENPLTHEVCGLPMKSHSARYRCAQHIMRTREQVDTFVLSAAAMRLNELDIQMDNPAYNDPQIAQINAEISAANSLIARARRDYDQQFIEGIDFKRIRDRQQAIIATLETSKNKLLGNASLGTVLGAHDPGFAFLNSDLGTQRSILDTLCTVYLLGHPRGLKTFTPSSVRIEWKA